MPQPPTPRPLRAISGAAATLLLLLLVMLPLAPASRAADGPTMTARALLQGHVRTGSWFAIAVDIANAGPTVTGEIRIRFMA